MLTVSELPDIPRPSFLLRGPARIWLRIANALLSRKSMLIMDNHCGYCLDSHRRSLSET